MQMKWLYQNKLLKDHNTACPASLPRAVGIVVSDRPGEFSCHAVGNAANGVLATAREKNSIFNLALRQFAVHPPEVG